MFTPKQNVHLNSIMKKMNSSSRIQVALLLVGAIKRDESGRIVRGDNLVIMCEKLNK